MSSPIGPLLLAGAALSTLACGSVRPHPARPASSPEAPELLSNTSAVTGATVVAFWLAGADTLAPSARDRVREEFRRSNAAVADYLSDTDIVLVGTLNDTVVVQLTTGVRRVIMLSGLDFPYGYLLIEPGYPEEFHTGIDAEQDLKEAIDDYFGLQADSASPKHRIAGWPPQRGPAKPGPRSSLPGLLPVWVPFRTTRTPFTSTCLIPTDTWWGCSKVARSATVFGSKTTRSA